METLFYPVENMGSTVGYISHFTAEGFFIAVYDTEFNWIENIQYDAENSYFDRLWSVLNCVCTIRHNKGFRKSAIAFCENC